MTTDRTYVVGMTDHTIGVPDLEAQVLGDDVEIDFFATTDEAAFDPARLARLDALIVWRARLGPKSIAHLTRCRGVVRYGVGYERPTSQLLQRPAFHLPTSPIMAPRKSPTTLLR